MSLNETISFPGDGFINVSSIHVFPPVWGTAASLANSSFYLCLFVIYFICFGWLLKTIRNRIKQNQTRGNKSGRSKGIDENVMKRNHIIMFVLAGSMVAIQCANLLIRIVNDILFMRARLIVEKDERVTYAHFLAIWVAAAFSTFFMFLNFVMLFVILFFVQMVFWRTAATMRAISKKAFRNIRIFTQITIVLFVVSCLIILSLASLFIPFTRFDIISKSVNTTINFVFLGVILLLFAKDTIAILISGILVIKTIRKSILKIKNATHNQKKMENPFIVTFSLLIGLIACIFLQILAVILGASLVADRDEFKFTWHFVNCAGILIFSTLTLALFYPMFIQTETVFKELHIDDTKSNLSENTTNTNFPNSPSCNQNRNSIIVGTTVEDKRDSTKVVEMQVILSPSDVTIVPNMVNQNETPTSSGTNSSNSNRNSDENVIVHSNPQQNECVYKKTTIDTQ